jgi:hypothetical protein
MGYDDPHPPNAERVHKRALVLAALSCRGIIEGDTANGEIARQITDDLLLWKQDAGIEDEFEPDETRLLHMPFGKLATEEGVNMSWLAEGMVVLAWALGRAALPPFWEQANAGQISGALGMLRPGTNASLSKAVLRDSAEIERQAKTCLTVHWRLVEHRLRPFQIDFAARVHNFEISPLPFLTLDGVPLLDGDMAIDNAPILRIPPARLRETTSIVFERHRAFNWLLGVEKLYSQIRADT